MRTISNSEFPEHDGDSDQLVKTSFISSMSFLPVVMEPLHSDLDLAAWLEMNSDYVQSLLLRSGGILLRGFDVSNNPGQLEKIASSMGEQTLEYDFASTPRSSVKGNIYTSTEYPAHQEIALHNEMAYSKKYPGKIWFYCVKPSSEGGETPLGDSQKIYSDMGEEIRSSFESRGLTYVRNYYDHLDLSWQKAFNTTEKSKVESYCTKFGIDFKWINDQHLQTREKCEGVQTHPATKNKVWFNQAHLFHISNLDVAVREALERELGVEGMPRNVLWGDGEPIEDALMHRVRQTINSNKIQFSWQRGDILLLDNLLVAHGRNPYKGERKVLVAMTA